VNQSKLELHVAGAKRGKTLARATIGFEFTSHWMKKKGASFFKPIVWRSKCKANNITFRNSNDNRLYMALHLAKWFYQKLV